MVKLTQFSCDLPGDFLKSMLDVATSNFGILCKRSTFEGYREAINIYYEAVLFTDALTKYLCETKMSSMSTQQAFAWAYSIESFQENCLKNMIRSLEEHVRVILLNRFYGLKLSPSDCGQSTGQAVQDEVFNFV